MGPLKVLKSMPCISKYSRHVLQASPTAAWTLHLDLGDSCCCFIEMPRGVFGSMWVKNICEKHDLDSLHLQTLLFFSSIFRYP